MLKTIRDMQRVWTLLSLFFRKLSGFFSKCIPSIHFCLGSIWEEIIVISQIQILTGVVTSLAGFSSIWFIMPTVFCSFGHQHLLDFDLG